MSVTKKGNAMFGDVASIFPVQFEEGSTLNRRRHSAA